MPAEWAASGARLAFPIDVEFQDELCTQFSERMLGEPEDTYRLRVLSPGKFVGVNGEVEVAATSGAWSQVATGRGGESFLRFFIDFPDGAFRNDVELPTGRVFFTNGCWIGEELELAQTAVEQLQEELAELEAAPVFSEGANPLQKIFELPKAVNRDEKRTLVRAKLQAVAGSLPGPSGVVDCPGRPGLKVGKAGGLSVKRPKGLGEAYYILGKFSMSPIVADEGQ